MIKYVVKHKSWDRYICHENDYVDITNKMEPDTMYNSIAEAVDDLRIYVSKHSSEKFSDYHVLTVQVCIEVVDVNEALPDKAEFDLWTSIIPAFDLQVETAMRMLRATYHEEPLSFNTSIIKVNDNTSKLCVSNIVWKQE